MNWYKENEAEINGCIFRNFTVTASHPVDYAKVLIQLGYEPFTATESTSFFLRKKYLGLPNVLTYLKYIKSVDGFVGCFRGLLPRLMCSNVSWLVQDHLNARSPFQEDPAASEKGWTIKRIGRVNSTCSRVSKLLEFLPSDIQGLIKSVSWNCLSVTAGITVSYPLHVIAVRSMAQFIGRETTYESFWGSIAKIFNTEGIWGFFKGLLPRLINEVLTVVVVSTFAFVIKKRVSKSHEQLTNFGGSLVANAVAYQYLVVSNNMIVNDVGLAIGTYPYAHKYTSWYDCWATLRREGQLNRAANVIARVYTGPAENRNGRLVPIHFPFGPIHPRGLGLLSQQ